MNMKEMKLRKNDLLEEYNKHQKSLKAMSAEISNASKKAEKGYKKSEDDILYNDELTDDVKVGLSEELYNHTYGDYDYLTNLYVAAFEAYDMGILVMESVLRGDELNESDRKTLRGYIEEVNRTEEYYQSLEKNK